MSIIRVGSHQASGASISVTALVGDLIVLFVCRDGSNAAPTIPAGTTGSVSGATGSLWAGLFWRRAVTANPTLSGFTDATRLACIVYRSDAGNLVTATRSNAMQTGVAGSGDAVSYTAVGSVESVANRWMVGACVHRSNDVDINVAPTGMSSVVSSGIGTGTGRIAIHDSNGILTSWPTTNVTLSAGTSARWRTGVLEIAETDYPVSSGVSGFSLSRLVA